MRKKTKQIQIRIFFQFSNNINKANQNLKTHLKNLYKTYKKNLPLVDLVKKIATLHKTYMVSNRKIVSNMISSLISNLLTTAVYCKIRIPLK